MEFREKVLEFREKAGVYGDGIEVQGEGIGVQGESIGVQGEGFTRGTRVFVVGNMKCDAHEQLPFPTTHLCSDFS